MKKKFLFSFALCAVCAFSLQVKAQEETPLITVSLLEPGSLGTEVLYNVDNIQEVKRLKVVGKMNADDTQLLGQMNNLVELDMSQATCDELPKALFQSHKHISTVLLPEKMKRIGVNAFQNSTITNVTFPKSLEEIGMYAFNHSNLTEAILPDDIEILGKEVFGYCYDLVSVHYPKYLTYIPEYCFNECRSLSNFDFPEKYTSLGACAFLRTKIKKVNIPESCVNFETSGGGLAFWSDDALTDISFPTYFHTSNNQLGYCKSLQNVTLCCANVVIDASLYGLINNIPSNDNVTIHVPSFLVNAYKLHPEWCDFKNIVPLDEDPLNLTFFRDFSFNRERFTNIPNVTLKEDIVFKVNGDDAMRMNNVTFNSSAEHFSQIISKCSNVSIDGNLTMNYTTKSKKWYFISLPFDLPVANIQAEEGVQFAVRYYDGAERATGTTGCWKNYESEAVIPAGTGFIFMTNKDATTCFTAANNATKNYVFSPKPFSKALNVYDSDEAANVGWNLVGNPYQSYYNNHMINFVAPITVWNVSNQTYSAYSLVDDDYALRPNEAFFVQCPSAEYNTIGFPITGRQTDNVIISQNASNRRNIVSASGSVRQLVDLAITDGNVTDQTRIVINNNAKMDYEPARDASKFFSMNNAVPQLYSLDEEFTLYAINERPLNEGNVQLGFYAATAGEYTISAIRSDAEVVYLHDNETDNYTDLKSGDYTFTSEAGQNEDRFSLSFYAPALPTSMDALESENSKPSYFTIDGRRISINKAANGVFINSNGHKMIVK